ncbi:Uncharacterised protein [Mycobacteroides abscessus subsp. abscessus]|nr:Uncharacterised protein [Mycobacteroides abscessus subsp. abscessus]
MTRAPQFLGQLVALEVNRHKMKRRRHRTQRSFDGLLFDGDVDRLIDLEHRSRRGAGQAAPSGVQAGSEIYHGIDR